MASGDGAIDDGVDAMSRKTREEVRSRGEKMVLQAAVNHSNSEHTIDITSSSENSSAFLKSDSSSSGGANPLVLSTTASTPLVTQAAGLVQTSIVVPQPPLPIFRQPTAMHLPHYPPNYIPYGHYFSPFYPPPAIHQFFSNGAYPQQPQAGSVYQPPPAATTTYSLSQYKQGA
nr:GBF-interacting protein 1-like isoform X4 [Ipomoea batatas]